MELVCILIGYLCGNFLTAEVVTRARGLDVREIDKEVAHHGNPGMANVMINVGFKPGVFVFIGDVLKVLLAYLITYLIYKDVSVFLYTGFGALLGHDFPFWRQFNGGKGVLVSLVWLVTIMPIHSWIVLGICALVVLITGYLNLSAVLIGLIAAPFAYFVISPLACVLVAISAVISIFRNKRDLIRIKNGEANKFDPFRIRKKK